VARLIVNSNIQHSTSMPQVLHRNISSNTELIHKIINLSFVLIELFSFVSLFMALFLYRLATEFNQPFFSYEAIYMHIARTENYIIFLAVVTTLWLAWSSHFKLFTSNWEFSTGLFEESNRVFKSISYSILLAIGIAFVFKLTNYSRMVILGFWISSVFTSIGLRSLKRLLILILIQRGILVRHILIIGAGQVGKMLASELRNRMGMGYNIIGYVDDQKKGEIDSIRVLGKIKDIDRIVVKHPIDEIIITIPTEKQLINEFINKYRKFNFTIRVIPEMFNLVSKTIEVTQSNNIPVITLVKTPMRGVAFIIKRTMDFFLASIGLIILIPIFIIISILIKVDSHGAILHRQRRVGKNGKFFNMYKFRSMVENAEDMKNQLYKLNEIDGPAFKIKDDPRITKIGKFIRKYSIDELPQLFNVLKGEMSLVGPRPPLPIEVERYTDWDWRKLEVVPGITGLWQVSGRSDVTFEQWVNLDVYYIENWSPWLDLKIVLKTIPVVLKGDGAY
jgi:exopolysaccharide biosynthesis polyprenyl glycosylphosphotransferase